MTDYRSVLERAGSNAPPADMPLARIHERRDRKRRNRRMVAGIVGAAVFLLPAIGFVRLLASEGGPATGPATSPSPVTQPPKTFTERFDSPLNGLSIGYPAGWRTRAATEPWRHDSLAFYAADVDAIYDPRFQDDLYVAVVSGPLGDKSPKDWVYDTLSEVNGFAGICNKGFGGGAGDPFQGNFAWYQECGESNGASSGSVIFATATRGYVIYAHVGDERAQRLLKADYPAGFARGWFERGLLQTVELPTDTPGTSTSTSQ